MKDGRDLGLLALGAMRLFAKTLEEGALMQGYLAAMSDNVVKGAFYKEMKEKRDLPWFTKDDTEARVLWDVSKKELCCVWFDLTVAAMVSAVEDVEISAKEDSDASLVEDIN
jgi:hypothetical protein